MQQTELSIGYDFITEITYYYCVSSNRSTMNCSLSFNAVDFAAFGLQPLNDSLVPCYDVPGLDPAVWLSLSAHGFAKFIF